ncbi:MAG: FHA domain-containing protein [Anaerolineae bacterium]
MEVAETLLVLRALSAILLVLLISVLIVAILRETNQVKAQAMQQRRSFGALQVLANVDGQYTATGVSYPLMPVTTLGRSPTNTIVIPQTFASAEHAILTLKNGQWWLEDRKSTNGTLLNDDRVASPTIVTDGDIIGIGHLYFRVVLK